MGTRVLTTEEMRESIQKYCLSEPKHCQRCKIYGPCFHYGGNPTVMSDIGIETCYNALTAHLVQPMVEDTNTAEKPLYDPVTAPKGYTITSVECIDMMEETQGREATITFCVCCAFKYLWRHRQKNGEEDIKKASRYLNKAVELMGKEKDQ